MPGPRPTVRLRQLGTALRSLREKAGKGLEEVGAEVDLSAATISRYERAQVRPRVNDVHALLDLYKVTDVPKRDALLKLAREARRQGWWVEYGETLSSPYTDYISLETDTSSILNFELGTIPGLLQTADYAEVVTRTFAPEATAEEIRGSVAVRIARQEQVLGRPKPPRLWFVVHEMALRVNVGGPQVMRVQLDRLREAAELPNVTLQVLPVEAGAHAGMGGSFVILEFPGLSELDLIHLEHATGGLYMEREDDISHYRLKFDRLRAAALDVSPSLARIERISKELA